MSKKEQAGLEKPQIRRSRPSIALAFLARQSTLRAEMSRAAAGRLGKQNGWEEKLLMALTNELQSGDGLFRVALESIARKAISVDACNDVLTSLRLQVLGIAASKPELRPRMEDMFQEGRLMLTNVALSAYRDRDQAATDHLRNISKACMEALAIRETSGLSHALSTHLPPLGVSACSISRLSTSSRRGRQLEIVAHLSPEFVAVRRPALSISSLGIDQTCNTAPPWCSCRSNSSTGLSGSPVLPGARTTR